jgi:hypothetical protein
MLKTLLLLGLIQLAFTQSIKARPDIYKASADPSASTADAIAMPNPIKGCPDCFVTQICGPYYWTRWFNRDSPTGTGDWETVASLVPLGGCESPIYIECQTVEGIPWWKTGDVIRFSTAGGCMCKSG